MSYLDQGVFTLRSLVCVVVAVKCLEVLEANDLTRLSTHILAAAPATRLTDTESK